MRSESVRIRGRGRGKQGEKWLLVVLFKIDLVAVRVITYCRKTE